MLLALIIAIFLSVKCLAYHIFISSLRFEKVSLCFSIWKKPVIFMSTVSFLVKKNSQLY